MVIQDTEYEHPIALCSQMDSPGLGVLGSWAPNQIHLSRRSIIEGFLGLWYSYTVM